jgi:hypothetical protein
MTQEDHLDGWKQIADHLKVSQKTAHRWEKDDNLPVIRRNKRRNGPVFAKKSALDAWLHGAIEAAVLEDNRLVAKGRSDRILWTFNFPDRIRQPSPADIEWRVQRVDLHGNGERGVLVAVRFLGGRADTLYYFSPQGKLEWMLEADPQLLDRNGNSFEKAWAFRHVIVGSTSEGSAVWAALAHEAGWAGCILRVDAHGKATVQFANAGNVEWLCHVASPEGGHLIFCGENNAFDQSFVGRLGTSDPPSRSAPGGRPRYQYASAPANSPRKYVLFPRTELIAARQKPYGHASRMRQYPDDIIVEVETGGDGGTFLYHFSPELEPKYVFPSGSHEFRHQDLEIAGKVDHPWENCPELDGPLTLNIWEPGTGWREEAIRWRDNPWKER